MTSYKNFKAWTKAHTSYDNYIMDSLNSEEIDWKTILLKSPHGQILTNNSLFLELQKKEVNLLHITNKLDEILSTKSLYSSGGCLIGSIYCTPLYNMNGKLYLSNLGDYIINYESKMALSGCPDKNKKITPLIIKVKNIKPNNSSILGIDYTKLGDIHFDIYTELKYLLSKNEQFNLENDVVERIKKNVKFLRLCKIKPGKIFNISPYEFINELVKAIGGIPYLGYIYFEVISEYLMLFSCDKRSNDCHKKGELNNYNYKNLAFNLRPNLLNNFNLGTFTPNLTDIEKIIKEMENKGEVKIDFQHFSNWLIRRISYLVVSDLFTKPKSKIDWSDLTWEYSSLTDCFRPLIGHMVHRLLRNFNRFEDFYYYFDQTKALQIWNFWNHQDIIFPFNGTIPKGEVGINPAYNNLEYEVWLGHYKSQSNTIVQDKLLDIDIPPRMVDFKNSFRRNKTN
ncbi:MAG: hypothetical protein PHG83_00735 [Patescibacteria group bacterium]|nr:hypothetical protein [Patescibacteria group bacterium]